MSGAIDLINESISSHVSFLMLVTDLSRELVRSSSVAKAWPRIEKSLGMSRKKAKKNRIRLGVVNSLDLVKSYTRTCLSR